MYMTGLRYHFYLPFFVCFYTRLGSVAMEQPSRRPPTRRAESPPDLSAFESVRQGLAESNTVGWQLAPMSIDLATTWYNLPESQRFLSDFLYQITGIMLDQVRIVCAILCRACSLFLKGAKYGGHGLGALNEV